jgi:hypothetical protein
MWNTIFIASEKNHFDYSMFHIYIQPGNVGCDRSNFVYLKLSLIYLHYIIFFFHTQACKKCCQFIDCQHTLLTDYVDGKNLEAVLTEFGIRIHRHLLDHLQQFQYTSMGKLQLL